jgi:8-oxo-dGTP pyrophosphatase MutT (NUDIX family)
LSDYDFTIPWDRLPPGFAESLDALPDPPATVRPAATVLLLRDAPGGVETLMLQRTRRSGFVPGAWVFAGGRVDSGDRDPEAAGIIQGLLPEVADRRLGLGADAGIPATAYYLAAVREAFEETGIAVGLGPDGRQLPDAGSDARVGSLRERLLADSLSILDVGRELGLRVPASQIEYVAHWITPIQEHRRYDTRFFAARVAEGTRFSLHASEMSRGRWMTPARALEAHAAGDLPMVFPTIMTLQSIRDFHSAEGVLAAFREREIPAILPRLVKMETGVGLRVP